MKTPPLSAPPVDDLEASSRRGESHPCPADGCDRFVAPHLLFCPYHWRLVPRNLQCRIYQANESGDRISYWKTVSEAKQAIRAAESRMRPEKALITGKTFDHREKLKAMGGVWDPDKKGWWVPASMEMAANVLVGNADGTGDLFADEGEGALQL